MLDGREDMQEVEETAGRLLLGKGRALRYDGDDGGGDDERYEQRK